MACALMIDDDAPLLESMVAAAELNELHLDTAASWEAGLASFHALSPELVICDYDMPGSRHGLRLLAEIRRKRPSTRLILFSGYIDDNDIERVLALGLVDKALTKGSSGNQRELIEEIRAAAEGGSVSDDLKAQALAYMSAEKVTDEALDALDEIIGRKVRR